jgi:hypothetical protein
MRALVFIDQTEGGFVEVSVVKQGLSSGAAHKYDAIGKAKAVLLAFGFDAGLVACKLKAVSETPPSVLLQFPVAGPARCLRRCPGPPHSLLSVTDHLRCLAMPPRNRSATTALHWVKAQAS